MSAIDDLTTEFARLPGIGRKTAQRLVYHLLKRPAEQSRRLADALVTLVDRVHTCERCFNLTEDELCSLCADPSRDAGIVCVVEEASDIASIERSSGYRGVYHVLGGHISPLDGVGPEQLTIQALEKRIDAGDVREVILATNPSMEGEATAIYIQRQLAAHPVRVTRIALGLPVGGDLEYADGVTIAQALEARREMR